MDALPLEIGDWTGSPLDVKNPRAGGVAGTQGGERRAVLVERARRIDRDIRARGVVHDTELQLVGVLCLVHLVGEHDAVLSVDGTNVRETRPVGPLEPLADRASVRLAVKLEF